MPKATFRDIKIGEYFTSESYSGTDLYRKEDNWTAKKKPNCKTFYTFADSSPVSPVKTTKVQFLRFSSLAILQKFRYDGAHNTKVSKSGYEFKWMGMYHATGSIKGDPIVCLTP